MMKTPDGPARAVLANAAAARIGRELVSKLRATPPVIATAEGEVIRPWQIGLGAELLALRWPDAPGRQVRALMRSYTASTSYLIAVAAPGSRRHSMNGAPVADITAEHRDGARQQFAERRVRRKEREEGAQPPGPEPVASEERPQAPELGTPAGGGDRSQRGAADAAPERAPGGGIAALPRCREQREQAHERLLARA